MGNITIIDFDTVSITNLTRSVLFRELDVGLSKVEVARKKALEINPEINIQAIHGDLEFDLGIGDVSDREAHARRAYRHLIIGCLDSVNARWAINQLSVREFLG
ncbi:MAG: ThiF family adenylyltransferase [Cyanobacteria bacterium J06635_10]